MTSSSHIVCLFQATAGQNGENLGSDETQIVLFVYLLYDISNNKVSGFNQLFPRFQSSAKFSTLFKMACLLWQVEMVQYFGCVWGMTVSICSALEIFDVISLQIY